jgi:hypothetical protein
MAPQGDSLLQLAVFGRFQLAIQLGLSGKDNLKQLSAPGFQISEKPDFFQNVPAQGKSKS